MRLSIGTGKPSSTARAGCGCGAPAHPADSETRPGAGLGRAVRWHSGPVEITHLGHAAVLVQTPGARILIDPGGFSDAWHGLTDLDGVLITHQHPDHIDPAHLTPLMQANPDARLLVEPGAMELVRDGARAQAFRPGDTATIGDVHVAGVGGEHACIHPDLPSVGNVGMVLRSEGQPAFFHPGDDYSAVPERVDVLAVPVNGPWAKLSETVAFTRAIAPSYWFPIHDALLSDIGRGLYLARIGDLTPAPRLELHGATAVPS